MPFEIAQPRDAGVRHNDATLSFHKRVGVNATVVLSMNKHFQDEHFGGVLIGGGAYVLVGTGEDFGKVIIGLCTLQDQDHPVPILANGRKAGAKVSLAPWDGLSSKAVRAAMCTVQSVMAMGEGAWTIHASLPASALRLPKVQVAVEFLPGDQMQQPNSPPPLPEPPKWEEFKVADEDDDAEEEQDDDAALALIGKDYGPKGPWPDELFAHLRVDYEDGKTIKNLAELVNANYQAFSSAFAAYRRRVDGESADAPAESKAKPIAPATSKPNVPPTPKPILRDPDPQREFSGWSFGDDIDLMKSLGAGMIPRDVAKRINARGGQPVMAEDVIKRFKVLCPRPSPEKQGVILGLLRDLKAAADANPAAE